MKKIKNTSTSTFMHGSIICEPKKVIEVEDTIAEIWLKTGKFDLLSDDSKDKEIESLKKELEKAKSGKKSKKSKKAKKEAVVKEAKEVK